MAIERIWQEFAKGHTFGKLRPMLCQLHEFGLLPSIFPELEDIPLTEIEKRLHPLKDYPHKAPLIAFLLPLFPKSSLEEQIQLGKKLKVSNLEQQFTTFLFHARELCHASRPVESVEWAYFYANPFSHTSLQIIGAHLEPQRQQAFLKEHEERIEQLSRSIDRIRKHDPVVKSGDLANAGIQPGKTMGRLLTEADRLSANQQIFDPEIIIALLKQSELWPK